jgi:DNA-binding response OmpR family regulator
MRVLLVEDESDLGTAIQKQLQRAKYVVDWVQDGKDAWELLAHPTAQYSVAILDWMLPGLSGIDICQRLRAQKNALPVLMLTARDLIEDRVRGLDAGADDYLVKPFGMVELLARLRALQRRTPQMITTQLEVGPFILDYQGFCVNLAATDAQTSSQTVSLTAKEFQLLEYFLKHPNQILSRDQIHDQLWALDTDTISNVVAAQVRLLRRKLAELDCDHHLETLYGLGYRFSLTIPKP